MPKLIYDKEKMNREVRRAFIPSEGYNFIFIDYDQIEMRLFAHFSKCQSLINGILAGEDPHTSTAYILFGKENVDKDKESYDKLRRRAKTINFGIIYGMGKIKLASSLGLSNIKANETLSDYHNSLPEIKEYSDNLTNQLFHTGRIRIVLNSSLMKLIRDYNVPYKMAYKGINIVLQGMAAYVIKFAMLRVNEWLEKSKKDIKMVMTIHDELVFEVNKKYSVKEIAKELIKIMEDRITFSVPITAEAEWSDKSWLDIVAI